MKERDGARAALVTGMVVALGAGGAQLACRSRAMPAMTGEDAAIAPPRAESLVDAGAAAQAPWPPVDHLDKIARYSGFRHAVTVGTHLVLVGCHKLRVVDVDGAGGRDVPVGDVVDGGDWDSGSCVSIVGSDPTHLVLLAQGTLVAVDAASGRTIWQVGPHVGSVKLAIPGANEVQVVGGIVAVNDDAGHVVGLAASDGHVVWTSPSAPPAALHHRSLVRSGDLLLRETGAGQAVQALDAKTGRVAWERSAGADEIVTVAASARIIAVHQKTPSSTMDGRGHSLVILDPRTGAVQHTWPRDEEPIGDLQVTDDAIYTSYGSTQRIDPATGAVTIILAASARDLVFARDAAFWCGPGSILYATDLATGAVVWSYGIAPAKDPDFGSGEASLIDDPTHPGEQLLVGSARHASGLPDDQDVILFRRGETAVRPRSVRIEGVMRGANRDETVVINGVEVTVDAKLRFAATVEARGMVLVEPRGAGISGTPRSIDVETGEPLYKVALMVHELEQGCH